jgi:hypothetical protein
MTQDEIWEWEWKAQPRWAKIYSLLLGVPSFGILVWNAFGGNISDTVRYACLLVFLTVALVQIFCLNRIIRRGDR